MRIKNKIIILLILGIIIATISTSVYGATANVKYYSSDGYILYSEESYTSGNTLTIKDAPDSLSDVFKRWSWNYAGITFVPGQNIILDDFRSDINLTAVIDGYTVTYKPNGGEGVITSVTKQTGSTTTLANSSIFTAPSGNHFKEWNTSADGSGTTYSAGEIYSANETILLYAIWTLHTNSCYTFNYHYHSGTSGLNSPNGCYTTYNSEVIPAVTDTCVIGYPETKKGVAKTHSACSSTSGTQVTVTKTHSKCGEASSQYCQYTICTVCGTVIAGSIISPGSTLHTYTVTPSSTRVWYTLGCGYNEGQLASKNLNGSCGGTP